MWKKQFVRDIISKSIMSRKIPKGGYLMGKDIEEIDETKMSVEIELEDGTFVECAIVTILTVNEKDYIVLLPLNEDGQSEEGEVWFYGYREDPDDPSIEPILDYIESDDEYEAVADAFDEFLDEAEYEQMKE